jgi:predicted O-methyltransferase YrrM
MNFEVEYNQAKKHKDEHVENNRRCGGEPYKSADKLFEVVKTFAEQSKQENFKILEIGTAVGFTTFVLQKAIQSTNKESTIDTIEYYKTHIDEARKNIEAWGGESSGINFLEGDAENILPTLVTNSYDLIFFDGYGVKQKFYHDFESLLKVDGVLITANKHLKSTEQEFFDELESKKQWKFLESFADTDVYQKK